MTRTEHIAFRLNKEEKKQLIFNAKKEGYITTQNNKKIVNLGRFIRSKLGITK